MIRRGPPQPQKLPLAFKILTRAWIQALVVDLLEPVLHQVMVNQVVSRDPLCFSTVPPVTDFPNLQPLGHQMFCQQLVRGLSLDIALPSCISVDTFR
ncbi:hypothetical protein PoB_003964100 [Plakobranchus ocellatus]|uniref:Secreted protein n=1 Tax=Plakobranchus ocellatus TaxID=259542 RepID=A0AAV4APN7_9GAST|nr:hypothetical protein PoB_003964100 [Plakobranchus ocellatus]